MVVRFLIGDMLTGRRIQWVPALSGDWSEQLNGPGAVNCTVTLKDPDVRRLGLSQSAAPGKAFLAAVDGDYIMQAGPIWDHEYEDSDAQTLTLRAQGMWGYFDRRVILPATDTSPSDPATDTNLVKSYQGMVRYYVEQAMSWPNGDVPIVLPDEIAGSFERNEAGASLAFVGDRLRQLNDILNGPDVQFQPRWTTDRLGVEWVLRIGTPTQPLLFSPLDVVFNVSVADSSVSNLRVRTAGGGVATRAFASGGRRVDEKLVGVASNPELIAAGFPALDRVDSSYSTVTLQETMQAHADELAIRSFKPLQAVSFDHQSDRAPLLSSFTVGDFAQVRLAAHPYLGDSTIRMRIQARSGNAEGSRISVTLQPEVDQ